MNSGNRSNSMQRIRDAVTDIIPHLNLDKPYDINDLTCMVKDRVIRTVHIDNRRLSAALKERDDLKHVSYGLWQRV